jgi:Mechanosensitive ion channel, conserved TM helix
MPEWMQAAWFKQIWQTLAPHLPGIALALGILIGGWLVALLLRGITFAGLKRTTIDDRLGAALNIENPDHRIERAVARAVYWVALAFVGVAFLERLNVKAVTQPIVALLEGLSLAVPSLLKAALIGLVGFVVATLVRKALVALLDKTNFVGKLESWSGMEQSEAAAVEKESKKKKKKGSKAAAKSPADFSQTLGSVAFWVIIALTAVPVLEALKIGVLAAPMSVALSVVSSYVPKVLGAALLGALGYFLGRMARAVVTAVLDKTGLDGALKRVGLGAVLGKQTAGSILGNVVMLFIFLHFAISAVGRLDIPEISEPLGMTLTMIYAFLPRLLVAGVLLAIGVAVGKIGASLARGILAAIGFNSLMVYIGLHKEVSAEAEEQQRRSLELLKRRTADSASEGGEEEDGGEEDAEDPLIAGATTMKTPADFGGIVFGVVIVLLFLRQALGTMGLAGLAGMLDTALGYLPQVLVAGLVLGAGMWAGGWAHDRVGELVSKSKDGMVTALPVVVRVTIISIAAMVALQQLGVGNQLIGIAFALVLGSICLALALAFGLGGREVAGRILTKEYEKRQG